MLEADVEIDRREFTVAVKLAVAPGERLALFGPSGSGKTTTLEAIAGLVAPRRGRVSLAGEVLTQTWAPRHAVPPWRRGVGLLRQDPGLFPHLTIAQNLRYAAGPRPDGEHLADDRHPARDRRAARSHARQAVRWPGAPGRAGPAAARPVRRPAAGRALHRPGRRAAPGPHRPGAFGGRATATCPGCWSPTNSRRRRRSPTGWPCSTAGTCCRRAAG